MPFKVSIQNPVRQLVQMDAGFIENVDTGHIDVKVSLHIQPDEIDVDEYTFTVRFKTAYLVLEPDNMETNSDSYWGMRVHPENVTTSTNYRTTATRSKGNSNSLGSEGEVSGSVAGVSGKATLKAGTEVDRSAQLAVERSYEEKRTYTPVAYSLDDRWKITLPTGEPLQGTFLRGDRLCSLSMPEGKPNKVGGTLHLMVRRKEIEVLVSEKVVLDRQPFWSGSANKQTLLNALVTKKLRGVCEQKSEETVTFATVEAEHEG